LNGKSERAVELFKEGYNCSQAVLAAYCEDVGIDMKTALMIASPLEAVSEDSERFAELPRPCLTWLKA